MTQVITVAEWVVPAEHLGHVLKILGQHAAATREEPGCLMFEVTRRDDPTQLVLIERYANDDALAAHRRTPHFARFVLEQLVPLLSSRKVTELRPIDAGEQP